MNQTSGPETLTVIAGLSGIRATALGAALTESSNSAGLDAIVAASDLQKNRDGSNIETISVKWIMNDDFADADDALLSLRPGEVNDRTDAKQSITAQIDYSISGEHGYAPGDIRIMVPAAMFKDRNGRDAGSVIIPLSKAPDKSTDFNWMLVDDYYVFTNTCAMSAATKGFIQIEWSNLTPHLIEDAYASIYGIDDNPDNDATYGDGIDHEQGNPNSYVPGESGTTGAYVTRPWYAYIEATTHRGNTISDCSGELRALMDTGEIVDEAYKRVQTGFPDRVKRQDLPQDRIPSGDPYDSESEFVIVDWYVFAHYEGNQPFSLDIDDYLPQQEGKTEYNGFIYKVEGASAAAEVTYSEDGHRVQVKNAYSGWPGSELGKTQYVHVYSAYPFSQFEEEPATYDFHNSVTYTMTPVDGADTPTSATARAVAPFSWHEQKWQDLPGDFEHYKWGNDGPTDYIAHNPSTLTSPKTISRMGPDPDSHYSLFYGKYLNAINELADGSDVTLYYTVKSGGKLAEWTRKQPADWDSTMVPWWQVKENYGKIPVTLVTTDDGTTDNLGLWLEGQIDPGEGDESIRPGTGTHLVAGSDYTFESVEFEKPYIKQLRGIGINPDGTFNKDTWRDPTFDFEDDPDVANIPPMKLEAKVGDAWVEVATIDWTSGSCVAACKNGATANGAMVMLPAGSVGWRTTVTATNAEIYYHMYPGAKLTPNGASKLKEFAAGKFKDSDGGTVYAPSSFVLNGSHLDVYQHDSSGAQTTNNLFARTKYGEDRIYGYTKDVAIYPSKEAEFDHSKDVDYEARQATVHYKAKVEERSFIQDKDLYDQAIASGELTRETSGTWYDLLPKGMVPDLKSVKLRAKDTIKRVYTVNNWRNTGRVMLVVEADLTPVPELPKKGTSLYYEDVPTISFDATMDLDTWVDLGGNPAQVSQGINVHNVVAFESGNKFSQQLTAHDFGWERDAIDQENPNNVRTRTSSFSEEEKAAFSGLDPNNNEASFAYAEITQKMAFPSSARTSLSKSIMVNDDGRWSQGTYDDERTVWEGGYYSYRLRLMSDSATKSKNLILYDSLENYYAVDGNDDADIDAKRWRGEYIDVDLSQIRALGCEPVVYYSTIDDLRLSDDSNSRRSNADNIDITNTDVWTTARPANPKDIHAIAIDCRKTAAGEDFILEPNKAITAVIRMHAPWGTTQWDDYAKVADMYADGGSARSYIAADAHAYNNVYLVSTSVDANADFPADSASTLDFVRFDYTKVGLKEYKIPVTKIWQDDNDRDGKRPDHVDVTLFANGEPAGSDVIANNTVTLTEDADGNWTGEFRNIPYTDKNGEKIYYQVRETDAQIPDGYTSRSIADEDDEGFTITNDHAPEFTTVSGKKTWSGDESDPAQRPESIYVQLYADGELEKTLRVEPDASGEWSYEFTDLYKYSEHGKLIDYKVEEVVSNPAYASEAAGYDLHNTYHPFGDVSITKKVSGTTAVEAGKEYEFEVMLESPLLDDQGKPITEGGEAQYEPLKGSFTWASDADPSRTGTIENGGTLKLAADETVTIKDLPNQTKVTFTEGDYPGFTTAGGAVKSTTVRQNSTREVAYRNTYVTEGHVNLTASKELAGARLKNAKFNFELLDEDGSQVLTTSNQASGQVMFGALYFDASDLGTDGTATRTYTIREIVPQGAEKVDGGYKLNGITYDTAEFEATVNLADNGEGQIEATVAYSPEARTFKNTYEAKGSIDLTAWKVLERRDLENEEFTFVLAPVKGETAGGDAIVAADVPMPAKTTAKNDASGTVKFDDIEFNQDHVGNTYYYAAYEVTGTDDTVVYDDALFGYKVVPSDNEDGTLSFTTGYVTLTRGDDGAYVVGEETDELPIFVNKLVSGSLAIEKTIVDADGKAYPADAPERDDEFNFRVKFTNTTLEDGDVLDYKLTDTYTGKSVGGKDGGAAGSGSALGGQSVADADTNPLSAALDWLGGLFAPEKAYAATVGGTFGTNDSCTWEFDDETKTLTLKPTDGVEGRWNAPGWYAGVYPWRDYKENIEHIVVQNTIKVTCSNFELFYNYKMVTADFRGFDVSAVRSLKDLVGSCYKLESIDVSGWDTSNVTNMRAMFYGCSSLKSLDLSTWDTSSLTNLQNMFSGAKSLTELDVSTWDTSNVTNMEGTFRNCKALSSLDLSGWNTQSVTSLYGTFEGCESLASIGVEGWNTGSVTTMNSTFSGCKALTSTDLVAGWDVHNLTDTTYMFSNCTSLKSVDLRGWDTVKLAKTQRMFSTCEALETVNLSGWNTGSLTDIDYMFIYDKSLKEADLSGWNTTGLTSTSSSNGFDNAFASCGSLKKLDLSGWTTNNPEVTYFGGFITQCTELNDFTITEGYEFLSDATSHKTIPSPDWNGSSTKGSYGYLGWVRKDVLEALETDANAYTSDELGEVVLKDNAAFVAAYTGDGYAAKTTTDSVKNFSGTWTWMPKYYAIAYDKGDESASGTMADEPFVRYYAADAAPGNWTREKHALADNKFTNGEKTFLGWATEEGGEVVFANGQQVTGRDLFTSTSKWPQKVTLYAVWGNPNYTIAFDKGADDAVGAMATVTDAKRAEAYALPKARFYRLGYKFVGWDEKVGSAGAFDEAKDYDDKGTIPANKFALTDDDAAITLRALWEKADTSAALKDGELQITLHGGERATFEDCIPAGTDYEVWEETPDGWKLIQVSNDSGTIGPKELQEAKFTNRHEEEEESDLSGSASLAATKVLKDENGDKQELVAGDFRFRLYEGEGTEGALLETVKNAADGAVAFKPIEYAKAGTYTYTIVEVKGTDDAIEYASDPITATVEVTPSATDETKLDAAVSYSPAAATFTNKKKEQPKEETFKLTVNKTAEGATEANAFTFEVALSNAKGQPIKIAADQVSGAKSVEVALGKATVTLAGAGSFAIAGLPEGTVYSVSETNLPAGWSLAESNGESGTLAADTTANFVNTYSASGLLSLKAYKRLEGGTLSEGQFTFGLYDNAACSGDPTQTQTNGPADANGKAEVSFTAIEVTEAGEHTYYVKEVAGDDETIEYSDEIIAVSIDVTDNGKGVLVAGDPVYKDGRDTFTNTKKDGSLAIKKILENATAMQDDTVFTVTLKLKDAAGAPLAGPFAWTSDRVGVSGGTVGDGGTLSIHGGETITVADLPDGAQYALEEDEDAAASAGFTQTAAEAVEGTIAATETAEASFTNAFAAGTSVQLEARKVLEGGTLKADDFTFQLKDADGAVIGTAKNAADGTATFEKLSYSAADAGKTFAYTISEVAGTTGGVTYDETVYDVSVAVAVGADGALSATPTYKSGGEEADEAVFTNTYTAHGDFALEVSKAFSDHSKPTKDQFNFVLKRPNGAALSKATDKTELAATCDATGAVAFEAIPYSQDDIGRTYTYIVTETDDAQDGITYDAHAFRVDVKVTDNGDGTLTAEPTKYGENRDAFTNKKFAPVTGQIYVKKTLAGRDWVSGDSFTFEIEADKDNPDAAAVPPNSSITITEADGASHTKGFGETTFKRAGGYRYTVSETKGTQSGITYDQTKHVIDIVVEENADGKLVAKQGSALVQTAEFENGYDASGSIGLTGTKTMEGRPFQAGDSFSFRVSANSASAPMPSVNPVTITPESGTEAELDFGTIEFGLADAGKTYTYTIIESGTMDGVALSAPQKVVVSIEDNHDGTLSVKQDGKVIQNATASFVNVFTPAKASLGAFKSINDWATAEQFEFALTPGTATYTDGTTGVSPAPADGKLSAVATKDPLALEASFGTIEYARAGTYEYTINEVDSGVDGILYDTTDHKAVVSVTKNPSTNALSAFVAYDPSDMLAAAELVVKNTFESGKMTLQAQKAINDWGELSLEEGRTFEFTLAALDGAPMPAQAGDESTLACEVDRYEPIAVFGQIEYARADEYHYTITETVPVGAVPVEGRDGFFELDGVTYDGTPHAVAVTVTKGEKNKLSAEASYDGGEALVIENEYAATGTAQLSAMKKLTGRVLVDDEFSFKLVGRNVGGAEHEEGTQTVAAANGDAGAVAAFDAMEFDLDDLTYTDGAYVDTTYTYTMTEVVPDGASKAADGTWVLDGVSYDPTEAIFEITLHDNGDGTITPTYKNVTLGDDSAAYTFENAYRADGSYQITAEKTMVSGDLPEEGAYTFTAVQVADAQGTPLADAETWTASNGRNSTITFPLVALTQDDFADAEPAEDNTRTITRYYAVSETVPEGAVQLDGSDWWVLTEKTADGKTHAEVYDGAVHIVSMTAIDDGNGAITAELFEDADGKSVLADIAFVNDETDEGGKRHNPHDGDDSVAAEASKKFVDAAGEPTELAADSFEFELVLDDEVIDTATNDADGKVAFRSLYFAKADAGRTYDYTIREKVPAGAKEQADGTWVKEGVVYDTHEESFTVAVTWDSENKSVVATGAYASEAGAVFTNKLEEKKDVTVVPEAKKNFVDGAGAKAALAKDQFTFELVDTDGKVVDTAKNAADGSVTFAPLAFGDDDAGSSLAYTIREKIPSGAQKQKDGTWLSGDIYYDGHEDALTIDVVVDRETGELSATCVYDKDGAAFTNKKKPSDTSKTTPKTGDTAPIGPLAASALAAFALMLVARRRVLS